jgi:hypothetical protein
VEFVRAASDVTIDDHSDRPSILRAEVACNDWKLADRLLLTDGCTLRRLSRYIFRQLNTWLAFVRDAEVHVIQEIEEFAAEFE